MAGGLPKSGERSSVTTGSDITTGTTRAASSRGKRRPNDGDDDNGQGTRILNKRRKTRHEKQNLPRPGEFPYELCEGRLLTDEDNIRTKWVAATVPDPEDGNADYCMICNKSGDMICCDKCPRAFHPSCVKEKIPEDTDWTCPMCIRDSTAHDCDALSGDSGLDVICTAFAHYDYCQDHTRHIRVLCKLYEMILMLMNFDFGYAFRDPVDLEQFTDYLEVVDTPMDLGTICSKIVNRGYDGNVRQRNIDGSKKLLDKEVVENVPTSDGSKLANTTMEEVKGPAKKDSNKLDLRQEKQMTHAQLHLEERGAVNDAQGAIDGGQMKEAHLSLSTELLGHSQSAPVEQRVEKAQRQNPLSDIILAILKDIETVWHNCFAYNHEQSAIYRMAEVQRRKYRTIKNCCIDDDLDPEVHSQLNSFVAELEQERSPSQEHQDRVHTIEVLHSKSRTHRRVVVYDPTSGSVVKTYSSVKAASIASKYIGKKLGYKAEIPVTDYSFKQLIRRSTGDPAKTLFGHRWMYESDFNSGKVALTTKALSSKRQDSTVSEDQAAAGAVASTSSAQVPVPEGLDRPSKPELSEPMPKSKESAYGGATTSAGGIPGDLYYLERTDRDNKLTIFDSIEEAYNAIVAEHRECVSHMSREEFGQKVHESHLVNSGEGIGTQAGVSMLGFRWKMVAKRNEVDETSSQSPVAAEKEETRKGRSWSTSFNLPENSTFATKNDIGSLDVGSHSPSSTIIKENVISCSRLARFFSIEEAYRDWLHTCETAGVHNGDRSGIDDFQSCYLRGDCHVNGIQWKEKQNSFLSSQPTVDAVEKQLLPNDMEQTLDTEEKKSSPISQTLSIPSSGVMASVPSRSDSVFDAVLTQPKQFPSSSEGAAEGDYKVGADGIIVPNYVGKMGSIPSIPAVENIQTLAITSVDNQTAVHLTDPTAPTAERGKCSQRSQEGNGHSRTEGNPE